MSRFPRTRRPYTLRPLEELPKVNEEHILPDSIGGSYGYTVRADEKSNSTLGTTVDAAFVGSPILAMLRSRHGVRSRSGVAGWTVEGTTAEGNHPVEVTLPHKGRIEVRFKKPFIRDDSGTKASIIVAEENRDAFIAQFSENMEKKGKKLVVAGERRSENVEIEIESTIEFHKIWVGIMKISYLAAFEFLGDAFLDDPLNPEWQKGIRATSLEEFEQVRIREVTSSIHHSLLIPPLESHEHGISICKLNRWPPIVTVRLFNSDMFTFSLLVSETSDFGLDALDGKVIVCDSITKAVTMKPFKEHFLKVANAVGPNRPEPAQEGASSPQEKPMISSD